GGPQNDGYEGCDGADGVGAHQQCTSQCVLENLPYCGDGTVDPGEACDDGNNTSGDGCSASCKNEGCVGYCGGGKVTYDPRLLMNKTVDHVFVYPNQEIIYTLEITNIGNEVGENLTLSGPSGCCRNSDRASSWPRRESTAPWSSTETAYSVCWPIPVRVSSIRRVPAIHLPEDFSDISMG
ncbi:MAG: hypothetical protein KKD59_10655, partial [Acidobacteria bacterium]|nr:hypothetical protein [Acidobacteriota bacterium]